MNASELAAHAAALRRGEVPEGAELLKRNSVRAVARLGGVFLKSFRVRPDRATREARNLERARAAGLAVPELLAHGPGWLATRFVDSRAARRDDLPAILDAARRMHAAGMLHGDFHLGNLRVDGERVLLTDLQRARFLPALPGVLQRRELGFLAYSLGEPLPRELEGVRFWYLWRAQRHWRSRTKRCLLESGSFTRFAAQGARGFRRREIDPERLCAALAGLADAPLLKEGASGRLWRSGAWIVKQHPSARRARQAWRGGHGLESRGVRTGRALAWLGPWLVMEDAGDTAIDWVERDFAAAPADVQESFADALGDLLATLHRRGIYHADLKANNVVWQPGQPPRLLDYARVHFGLRVPLRRRVKNLAQLNAALPDEVPAALRERAFERYLAGSPPVRSRKQLRTRVIRESLRRHHRWSGC